MTFRNVLVVLAFILATVAVYWALWFTIGGPRHDDPFWPNDGWAIAAFLAYAVVGWFILGLWAKPKMNQPKRYRKRPVDIEAIRWEGENYPTIKRWAHPSMVEWSSNTGDLLVKTLEGTMQAHRGDWIIKGIAGEVYLCKPHIFAATYKEQP